MAPCSDAERGGLAPYHAAQRSIRLRHRDCRRPWPAMAGGFRGQLLHRSAAAPWRCGGARSGNGQFHFGPCLDQVRCRGLGCCSKRRYSAAVVRSSLDDSSLPRAGSRFRASTAARAQYRGRDSTADSEEQRADADEDAKCDQRSHGSRRQEGPQGVGSRSKQEHPTA